MLGKTPVYCQSGPVLSRRADTLSWIQVGRAVWSTPGLLSQHTITRTPPLSPRRTQCNFTAKINKAGVVFLNKHVVPTSPNTPSTSCSFPLKINLLTVYGNCLGKMRWTQTVRSHGKALRRNYVILKKTIYWRCSANRLLVDGLTTALASCSVYRSCMWIICLGNARLVWLFACVFVTELSPPQGCHRAHCRLKLKRKSGSDNWKPPDVIPEPFSR